MKTNIRYFFGTLLLACLTAWEPAGAKRAAIETKVGDPYIGAIIMDADSGQVLFEDRSDAKGYPASVLKLMDLLIILEKINQGAMKLDEKIAVTAEASTIGGSQVYLKEHEVFSVDELLYALMVQSANDAAAALAIQAAGSKEGFVALMNQRAKELGLKATEFHTIHGLPPAADQAPDITSARDMARLARELLKYPDCLRYTGCRTRPFRDNKFTLENHNHLLFSYPGCDGFKTGWFKSAGYSVAATAKKGNTRIIAVVLGGKSKNARDRIASELLTKGFALMAQKQALTQAKPSTNVMAQVGQETETPNRARVVWAITLTAMTVVIVVVLAWFFFLQPRNKDPKEDLLPRHKDSPP